MAQFRKWIGSNVRCLALRLEDLGDMLATIHVKLHDAIADAVTRYCGDHEKPCFTARHKVWTFPDLARRAAAKHDPAIDKGPEVIGKAEGVEIVVNPQADRVQIVFVAKPSIEMIGKLRAEAWNWSRTEGA
jgi:hypothetical protein